jgi:hypothetical protein
VSGRLAREVFANRLTGHHFAALALLPSALDLVTDRRSLCVAELPLVLEKPESLANDLALTSVATSLHHAPYEGCELGRKRHVHHLDFHVGTPSLTVAAWRRIVKHRAMSDVAYRYLPHDQDIAGHVLLTWQDVVERDYHAWDRDRLVVDTAASDVSIGVRAIVEAVSGCVAREEML